MLGYFAVSCGAAREGQKNKMKICNQDAIFWPSWSHVGPIWEVCWVVLWCHMVCGVALCCDKRLTFVNVTIVRFTKGRARIVKLTYSKKRRKSVAEVKRKRSKTMYKLSEGNAKAK